MSTAAAEVLEFSDLTPYLLLKNGNYLYKVPFRDGWAVLKVYYGSRGFLETCSKSLGNVLFEGQTSYFPLTRLQMERECLDLWASHGFRVFGHYDVEVRAPKCPPGGYLLLEYVDAPVLDEVLRDGSRDIEERWQLFRDFLPVWCRRHDIAEAEREPRLVHENGDGGHVMILDEEPRFLWFDFEMVYRSRSRVREYLGHEIVQYLWMLLRKTPPEMHEQLIEEAVRHYPNPERMAFAPDVFLRHPRPLVRLARGLDRRRKRARKPSSKYRFAERLRSVIQRVG